MGPELLVAALVTWAMARYGALDFVHAVKGTTPPREKSRRERERQRHERAMGRTGPTIGQAIAGRIAARVANPPERKASSGKRQPGRDYLRQLWRDACGDAGDRHDRRRERKAAGELPTQRARRRFRDWRDGKRDSTPGERTSGPETSRPDPETPGETEPETGGETDARPEPETDDETGRETPGRRAPSHVESERLCSLCRQSRLDHCRWCDSCTPTQECVTGECVQAEAIRDPAPEPDPEPVDEPATQTPEPTPAPVTPIRRDPLMPTTSNVPAVAGTTAPRGPAGYGEIENPEAGLAFCDAAAGAIDALHQEFETAHSSAAAAGVTGPDLEALQEVLDSLDGDRTKIAAARAMFARHQDMANDLAADGTTGGGTYMGIGA